MSAGTKRFIFNRKRDWLKGGYFEGLTAHDSGLRSHMENGYYISRRFDSMEDGTVWHRLRMKCDIPLNSSIRLLVFASNTDDMNEMFVGNVIRHSRLDYYITDEDVSIEDKMALLVSLGAKEYDSIDDVILFSATGRYLWLALEIVHYDDKIAHIEDMILEFPRVSFVNYLPQIYRGDSKLDFFLARFLAIFQSIYVDLEDEIDDIANIFNPDRASPEFLYWLTSWFNIKDSYIWTEEKLRFLLKNIARLYKLKGTRQAIHEIVQIYTGAEPTIIEHFEIENNDFYNNDREFANKLYGEDNYTFTLLVSGDFIKTTDSYVELMRIINQFKPIDAVCNLVILSDEMYLDYHCYLGINSYTSINGSLALNGEQTIPGAAQ